MLYGKEIPIKNWLAIDLFAGLGYFKFNYNQGSSTKEYKKDTMGFPLQSRIKFKTGKTFSLGLQLHSNINSATTIYQPGLSLQCRL
ncbi:MAG TPA: hypothetical protein DDZ39_08670 [Flavobacteriaceae bacterium]|nr:hypothetical protein [Flavobacteriaceae bacterium]HBS11601.1 hypothetical protein [Flavobacteriaceae bacterium]